MKKDTSDNVIALNKKAQHDFFIEQRIETGVMLEGWEVKSLRAGRVQLRDSYVTLRHGEAWLIGSLITPLPTVSTHISPDAQRSRKLLLKKTELKKLIGFIERKGYALVPLKLYWARGKVKCEIGLAKGKKEFDKRDTLKQRDWERQKARLMKSS